MISEITIVIKDTEKTLRKKFLQYEIYHVSDDDPIIQECIKETLDNFHGEPENIKVIINMVIE